MDTSISQRDLILARQLRLIRPACVPGTNVILDNDARGAWYAIVDVVMSSQGITSPDDVKEFCDAAGVPS